MKDSFEGKLSFNIKTYKDFFWMMQENYNDFRANPVSARLAINVAMNAWHFTEWIYHDLKKFRHFSSKYKNLRAFQDYIKNMCSSFDVIQDIATGSKHYFLDRHIPKTASTELKDGDYSREYNRGDYDVSELEIHLDNGQKVLFEDEIRNVIDFWEKYTQDEPAMYKIFDFVFPEND